MAAPISLLPATSVGQGEWATQPGKIDYPGDVDMYTFTATVTGNMTISQTAAASNVNSILTVYDATTRKLRPTGAPTC